MSKGKGWKQSEILYYILYIIYHILYILLLYYIILYHVMLYYIILFYFIIILSFIICKILYVLLYILYLILYVPDSQWPPHGMVPPAPPPNLPVAPYLQQFKAIFYHGVSIYYSSVAYD